MVKSHLDVALPHSTLYVGILKMETSFKLKVEGHV